MKLTTIESILLWLLHNGLIIGSLYAVFLDPLIACYLLLLSISMSLREQGGKISIYYKYWKQTNSNQKQNQKQGGYEQ